MYVCILAATVGRSATLLVAVVTDTNDIRKVTADKEGF